MSGFRLRKLLYIANNDGWDIFIEKYLIQNNYVLVSMINYTYNVDFRNELVM